MIAATTGRMLISACGVTVSMSSTVDALAHDALEAQQADPELVLQQLAADRADAAVAEVVDVVDVDLLRSRP